MTVTRVTGDLLDQPVAAIVNPWNRNVIPWWLLISQGVSGAIKRRAGTGPFKEVARHVPIPLGGAVVTGAGRLPLEAIVHVAGINLLWRSSEKSVRDAVRNALAACAGRGLASVAVPLIGAGSGGGREDHVEAWILDELATIDATGGYAGAVRVVRYGKG